ncbi:unnamed protein product, partial [marine sediment metagenome]
LNRKSAIIFVLFLLHGCGPAFHAPCLDTAILHAQTFKDKSYEVRIAYGKTFTGKWHVQAQVKVKDEWKWLVSDTFIMTGRKHNFTIKKNLTLEETKRRWRRSK